MVPGGGELKVAWALSLLEGGVESKNLAILATLHKLPNEFEVDEYFNKVLAELKIEKPATDDATRGLAKVIAHEVIDGDLAPLDGVEQLQSINSAMGYPEYLSKFVSLADEWYSENIDGLSLEQRKLKIVDSCRALYGTFEYPEIFTN